MTRQFAGMTDSQLPEGASDAATLSWILRACQEYEQWHQDWAEYVRTLAVENEQLRRTVAELEGEKSHMGEHKSLQQRMIETQQDLISCLKSDIEGGHGEFLDPGKVGRDPSLPKICQEPFAGVFVPPTSPSDTYSAALLMALADSASAGEETEEAEMVEAIE